MPREDAPVPTKVPVKRRAIERAPDHWLAHWATNPDMPEATRARVQEVRDARSAAKKRVHRIVGLLVDREGVTSQQFERMVEFLRKQGASEIHHPWVSRAVHGACVNLAVPVTVHKDVRDERAALKEIVRVSMVVLALPRGEERINQRTPVWEAVYYARNHRRLEGLTIVLPNGQPRG